jgi:hypothetical protein
VEREEGEVGNRQQELEAGLAQADGSGAELVEHDAEEVDDGDGAPDGDVDEVGGAAAGVGARVVQDLGGDGEGGGEEGEDEEAEGEWDEGVREDLALGDVSLYPGVEVRDVEKRRVVE